ncbi:hypothetical protein RHPLAN_56780 [Rhodoplanes sp. Z2-YC6860]|nr:hypothetical protein RHPLAN_56780 [Rhodoplanes sp. Z2-YC6860]
MEISSSIRSRDWLSSPFSTLFAWWLPKAVIIGGLFASTEIRTAIWIAALAWMGLACIFNAKRCGRTHCRYTGPFYLAMIGPTLLLGSGTLPVGILGWSILACVILLGGKILWWVTERAWGEFS